MNWYQMFDTRAEAEAFALANGLSADAVDTAETTEHGYRHDCYAVAYND